MLSGNQSRISIGGRSNFDRDRSIVNE